MLYAAPNRLTRHRLAKLDLPRSDSMRAPGDAIGLLALECAMDELADALRLDPVELRLRNDTQTDPERHTAVRLAPSRRSVARGRRPLRLGQARRKAGQRPRRALACRSRRRLARSAATYCRARPRVRAWRATGG